MFEDDEKYNKVPYFEALATYLNYAVLNFFGYIADFLTKLLRPEAFSTRGYAPLVKPMDDFYTRHCYARLFDCWARPICSAPGARVDVIEREDNIDKDCRKELKPTGRTLSCINLASYNYLGYGEVQGGIDQGTLECLSNYGVSTGANGIEGRSDLHAQLESTVARFLGKEDSLVLGMGFATNSQLICGLVGPGSLIISDSLNHASIVVGARTSGAKIKTFAHNDGGALEDTIRESIATGQPGTGEPWNKILIIVEGVYSMEGEICALPDIVRVKKKYGAYLFLDEAHSIGAMGETGRGVCEYWGVDTADVDIMMGTFTKSFGATGGYVASSKAVINLLRYTTPGYLYATAMSPPCVRHVLWVLSEIMGEDGNDGVEGRRRIRQLRENTVYLREKLSEMGLQIYGEPESPVIPIMIYGVGKIASFSRECLSRGLAVVVVGFPATPLILSRARICASAAHTREDLDEALAIIAEVAHLNMMFYDPPSLRGKGTEEKIHQTDVDHFDMSCNRVDDHVLCNGHCLIATAAPGLR